MTNAAIDIMYIDMQRKWDHMNPERTSGKSKYPKKLYLIGIAEHCYIKYYK